MTVITRLIAAACLSVAGAACAAETAGARPAPGEDCWLEVRRAGSHADLIAWAGPDMEGSYELTVRALDADAGLDTAQSGRVSTGAEPERLARIALSTPPHRPPTRDFRSDQPIFGGEPRVPSAAEADPPFEAELTIRDDRGRLICRAER